MTDSKALIERLREWPMREQVQTYDHTFHIAETGSSYTTKRVIPQSPKPVMHEAADHIEKLEAEQARLQGLLREAEVKLTDVQGAYATKRYADNLLARISAALQETSHDC